MKKIIMIIVMLFISGCATPYLYTNILPETNKEITAGIGKPFFWNETYYCQEDPIMKIKTCPLSMMTQINYNYSLVELTNERIGIEYNEYKNVFITGTYLWFLDKDKKQTLYFNSKNKVIKLSGRFYAEGDKMPFRDFEFEILAVEENALKLRRIK